MEISEKTLWDKCFESMSEDKYCSTTLERLNHIFHGYLLKKAAAYDRIMSGSVQGMKEWANILGKPVAIDDIGRGWWFTSVPKIINGEWDAPVKALIPDLYIGSGISDWENSLTLPDGWEEK